VNECIYICGIETLPTGRQVQMTGINTDLNGFLNKPINQ